MKFRVDFTVRSTETIILEFPDDCEDIDDKIQDWAEKHYDRDDTELINAEVDEILDVNEVQG